MEYVEQRDGGYYLAGSRIGFDAIVYRFNEGASPETLLRSFPLAGSLERIYGAITFYLSHKAEVDAYLLELEQRLKDAPVQPGSEELAAKLKQHLVSR